MKLFIILLIVLAGLSLKSQNFRFAIIADTHIGGTTASEDLQNTIDDINKIPEIEFVIFAGDITEFGSESELVEAKSIIDKLTKPWYIVSGNHDSKWSESGNNDFKRIFGYECFQFEKYGIIFIGTSSGPVMRMAEGQVPREQILFLESTLKNIADINKPIIFVNHYPLDKSLANWYQIIDLLKTGNIQLSILGHGHSNKIYDFEGIAGVMCRSNLRNKNTVGGYNIVSVKNGKISFAERISGQASNPAWFETSIKLEKANTINKEYSRPDYSVNSSYPEIKIKWEIQLNSDIATGVAVHDKIAIATNTSGEITAFDIKNGQEVWKFNNSEKIFSTPAIKGKYVVCASTDGNIYSLDINSGNIIWSYKTAKAIVASPIIDKNAVFIGSSEGIFRAVGLKTGALIWKKDSINNFVETRPLIYKNAVFFGSWGNTFYALDKTSGELIWKREKYQNRMFSPAGVWPVAAKNKIFIVAPDRRMTALNAQNGEEIWDSGKYSCRESIGISENKKIVFIKNVTEGKIIGFDTSVNEQKPVWECNAELGYEISPTPIIEKNGIVFAATTNGQIIAIEKKSEKVKWKYKISNTLINSIQPISKSELIVTTFDGKIVCIKHQ